MTQEIVSRNLGDVLFSVDKGNIVRTVVSKLSMDGEFQTLNGSPREHSFECYEDALAAALAAVQQAIDSGNFSRNKETEFQQLMERMETPEYRDEVFKKPLHKSSQMHGLIPAEEIIDPVFPENYFRPGEQVYAIVTPLTHDSIHPGWRPHVYFILKLTVEYVTYAPRHTGNIAYGLNSRLHVHASDLVGNEADARELMVRVFAVQTHGTIRPEAIPLETAETEQAARKKQTDDMIAMFARSRSLLADAHSDE